MTVIDPVHVMVAGNIVTVVPAVLLLWSLKNDLKSRVGANMKDAMAKGRVGPLDIARIHSHHFPASNKRLGLAVAGAAVLAWEAYALLFIFPKS